jgi:ABC-type microcin C transport system permease subunit YejB
MPFLFIRAIWNMRRDAQFVSLAALTSIAIATGTAFYSLFEGLRVVDAFYFSVTTLCTVGYGDFTPENDGGKIFTAFYMLIGIGILLSFVTKVAGQVVHERVEHHNGRRRPK